MRIAVGDKVAASIGQVGQVRLSEQDGGMKVKENKEVIPLRLVMLLIRKSCWFWSLWTTKM